MHVLILINEISEQPTIDELDVLSQASAVEDSLRRSGHRTSRLTFSLNLVDVKARIVALRPDAIFNLVESVAGTDRLMPLATLLAESLGIPFTGSSSHAIIATSGKVNSKQWMLANSLPTAAWYSPAGGWHGSPARRVIVKAVWEHASFGMTDDAVMNLPFGATDDEVTTAIRERIQRCERETGRSYFAEEFIDGREITITLLARDDNPAQTIAADPVQLLPPAEILFVGYSPEKPKIVGFASKWIEGASEYNGTPRTFQFPPEDSELLDRLRTLARQCWRTFGLGGYARVDFRIDEQQRPWILEINCNPCIAPDAGFAAAIEQAGVTYDEAIRRILKSA